MEEFEGKVIVYADSCGHKYEGYIAGCDYDIGITIVNNEDKDNYLYCLKGPSAYPELYKDDSVYQHYNEKFEEIIEMFKNGFFNIKIALEIGKKYGKTGGNNAGPHTCAFNK